MRESRTPCPPPTLTTYLVSIFSSFLSFFLLFKLKKCYSINCFNSSLVLAYFLVSCSQIYHFQFSKEILSVIS